MQLVIHGFGTNLLVTGDFNISVTQGASPTLLNNRIVVLTLPLQQEVYETNDQLPIVGTRAARLEQTDHDIEGFMHDRRRWEDEDDITTGQASRLFNGKLSAVEGTLDQHWLSGIGGGDDCKYLDLYAKYPCTWLPRVLHGDYFINWKDYYLWSEESIIVPYVNSTPFVGGATDKYTNVPLSYRKKPNTPMHATIFRRAEDLTAEAFWHADYVDEFTGIADLSTREREGDGLLTPPFDDSAIERFNNFEILYREDVGSPEAYLSSAMYLIVGELNVWELGNGSLFPSTDTIALQRVNTCMEQLGVGSDTDNQAFFTRYFPLWAWTVDSMLPTGIVEVPQVITNDGTTARKWTLATDNSLSNHSDTEYVFEVDYDYGIIKFARNSVDAVLFLDEAVSPTSSSLLVDDATLLPASGRVKLGTEEIQYTSKENNVLGGLIRGVNGTTAAAHAKGASITPVQCGRAVSVGETVAISYVAVPRIEYEPLDFVDWIIADTTNVHPLLNPSSNGIVYIGRNPLEVDELILSIDKPSLGGGLYGPLAVGSDSAILTATAFTALGTPIPGLTITIDELNDPFIGLLNGSPADYTSISNQDGEISAPFTIGTDLDLVGMYAETTVVAGGQTLITVDREILTPDLAEILLFAVTKDDPSIGTVGIWGNATGYASGSAFPLAAAKLYVGNVITDASNPSTVSSLPVKTRYPDGTFDGGTITVVDTLGTEYLANIIYWRDGVAHIDQELTLGGAPDYVKLMDSSWTAWIEADLNGKKKVIYEYDPTAVHPATSELGAYFPVQPISSSITAGKTTFVFDFILPIPSATVDANNLGAYWLSLDAELSFQAFADSILTGKRVFSNIVRVRVSLPDYLKGVALENSSQIPYGFKFIDSSSSASSGLGGSTFVTINPISGSYLALSNPFASISFLLSAP